MKRDNVNYFLVGCFVLAMIGAFFVLMYYVTGRTGPTDQYYVYYDNVSGLKYGTGVFYEGYRVGQVERVEPHPDTKGVHYKITLDIARGWHIPDDSVARVVASGLIAAVTIEIDEGKSTNYVAPGGEIAGEEQVDLFAMLGRAAADFHTLSEEGVMPVLDNLNNRITEVAEEMINFRKDELTPFMQMVHARIDQDLIGDVRKILTRLDDGAKNLQEILGQENRRRVESFLVHIDDAAVNVNDLMIRIESTRARMDEVLAALGGLVNENAEGMSRTIEDVDKSVREIRRSLTTVNEHLDTILYHVEGSARNMHEFTRAIRENPARLLRGSGTNDEASSP